MKKRACFSIIAIIALFVGLSSCASKKYYRTEKAYYGPERNQTELAIIDMGEYSFEDEDYTILLQVDSLSVSVSKRCEILPGKHTVEIRHVKWKDLLLHYDTYLVTFEGKAGKTYSIKAFTNQEEKEVYVQVIDTDCRELVPSTAAYKYTLRENSKPKNQNISQKRSSYNNLPIKKGYDGPKQNKSSLARVKETGDVHLYLIDSVFVGNKSNKNVLLGILPGTHTIDITHNIKKGLSSTFIGCYLVTFDAEAGKTYTIDAETDLENSIVDVYVTEAMSGEIVPSIVEHKYKLKEKN